MTELLSWMAFMAFMGGLFPKSLEKIVRKDSSNSYKAIFISPNALNSRNFYETFFMPTAHAS